MFASVLNRFGVRVRPFVAALLAVAVLTLAGCGGADVEGTYEGQESFRTFKLELKSDGTYVLNALGSKMTGTYEVSGGKVKITQDGQSTPNHEFDIEDDGTLRKPGMGAYVKTKAAG